LPGSGTGVSAAAKQATPTKGKEPAAAAAAAAPANLIDFDSRPPSTVPPEPKVDAQAANKAAVENNENILHPTSNPQVTSPVHQSTATQAPLGNAKQGNLLDFDDDHDVRQTTSQMSNLNMSHQAMQPRSPLQRTDTGTSEVDVFVDAEEK
jgi:hypothetical protein